MKGLARRRGSRLYSMLTAEGNDAIHVNMSIVTEKIGLKSV